MGNQPWKTLSNGVHIPQLGLGVYKVPPEQVQETVTSALNIGYRHIDTASYYNNEVGVGEAIKHSGMNRSDVFVTTKVWNDEQGYDNTLKAFEQSLDKLQLDDVDLYLIHWPVPGMFSETWRALERLYEEGRVKAIGVSNFLDHHLKELFATAHIKPTVDQIELHPKLFQTSTVDFCRAHDIVLQSWSPLGRANYLEDKQLIQIAKKYHKTVAQVMIRWHIQHDFVVIPKSTNPSRQRENFDVFDFELSKEDMAFLNGLDAGLRVGSHPDEITR